MEPLVSVIVPTYNILDKGFDDDFTLMINLLEKQTYPNVELIIIDNLSTDGTVDLLKEYKNLGYLTFYSERDTGKFDAYNKGIMRAQGKYLSFISCDDFFHDVTGIAEVVNIMEELKSDFCFFHSYCTHPEEGYVFPFPPAVLGLFQVPPCPRQAIMFKKNAVTELRCFDTKFRMTADYDLLIRLMLNGYSPAYYGTNILTCKLGEQGLKNPDQMSAEYRNIFAKNYKSLYPLKDSDLDDMVNISEFPEGLLNVLVQKFPPDDKELFFQCHQQIRDLRANAQKNARRQRNL